MWVKTVVVPTVGCACVSLVSCVYLRVCIVLGSCLVVLCLLPFTLFYLRLCSSRFLCTYTWHTSFSARQNDCSYPRSTVYRASSARVRTLGLFLLELPRPRALNTPASVGVPEAAPSFLDSASGARKVLWYRLVGPCVGLSVYWEASLHRYGATSVPLKTLRAKWT